MMKLNALSISEYGICRNLRIDDLENGLNLIFGRNGSGKSTLIRFIRNALYGFPAQEADYTGHLDVVENGMQSRLHRDRGSALNPIENSGWLPGPMLDESVFDTAFVIDGRSLTAKSTALAQLLRHKYNVAVGLNGLGNDTQYQNAAKSIFALQSRLETIARQTNDLESERSRLVHQIDSEENMYQVRRRDLENNIRQLTSRIESVNLSVLKGQIESMDREIAELRLKIDASSDQIQYVSKPYKPTDGLAVLYRRLDEIDNQIRRWRAVHSDVQQQRVQLKDEMVVWNELTMESATHPYHRSRQLLNDIESKLLVAENSIDGIRHLRPDEAHNASQKANELTSLCSKIRDDLYSLCDELGAQYKSVRHRGAAAELKRLRRCYHEIGDNIESLIDHRRIIVDEIRQLDSAGAAAIVRADHEFCTCAQHEGYLQARRTFVGEIAQSQRPVEVVKADVTVEKTRLSQLEQQRADRVRELVRMENELSDLKAQRKSFMVEFERTATVVDVAEIRMVLDKTQLDLNALYEEHQTVVKELEWHKTIRPEPGNPILEAAGHWVQKLTNGEIRRIWILADRLENDFEVETKANDNFRFNSLGSGLQQQVALAISLALVDNCRNQGQHQTLLLDDVFVNLDPSLIESTLATLLQFCDQGQQAIALTSDQTVRQLAVKRRLRQFELPVFDLPETTVSPVVPLWNPERGSDLPYRDREHYGVSDDYRTADVSAPSTNYQPTSHSLRSERPGPNFRPVQPLRSLSTEVPSTGSQLVETADLIALQMPNNVAAAFNNAGVYTVAQLLELDPAPGLLGGELRPEEIDHWQSLAWLLICVPVLDIVDAELLIALGINEPEQLESTHSQQLVDRISRFVNTNEGRRLGRGQAYGTETVNRWYDSLGLTRSRWRLRSGYSRRNRWNRIAQNVPERSRPERSTRDRGSFALNRDRAPRRERRSSARFDYNKPDRQDRTERITKERSVVRAKTVDSQPEIETRPSLVENADLKFYLNQSDDLEAAPAIGPKTAERFAKIGVRTVGEFLTQTAESMATKIKYKRITADVIRQWQHQARLVCRVPNLRGHDAQLLVACGITEPEELAAKSIEKLFSIVQPFSESKEGLKIIRGGKQPDLDEITDWINWAQQTRSLQAA